jgi:hypothetical protein
MKTIMPIVIAGLCGGWGCSAEKPAGEEVPMAKKVMVSTLAGRWYPAGERALREEIAERCKGISVVRKKNVCAAVVPHAGYRYSGSVAAGVFLRIAP